MVAHSQNYLNYWERCCQPDVKILCTPKTRFSPLLLLLLEFGSILLFPNTYPVLLVRHIHWLNESWERLSVQFLYCHGKLMVTFQTGVNSWFNTYYFHFSICQEKQLMLSINSCCNRLLSKTGWFVPCIQLLQYKTINVFPICCFALFHDLKTKWK